MKRIKKLITSVLLGALTLSVFAFTGCGKTTEETSKTEKTDVGIAVLTSYTETTSEGQTCLVKELVATVSGDNVTNVELEWSTAWEQANDEDINNYLVLEPSAFNEESKTSTCKIKLIAPLSDTAIVYVKCKNNDLTAKCFVDYSPSTHSISVDVSSLNVVQDSYYNADINILTKGTSYGFDISSLGFFGEEVSLEDIEIECTAVGDFYLKDPTNRVENITLSLLSFINPELEYGKLTGIPGQSGCSTYFNYSIDNNKLIINAVNVINNLKYQIFKSYIEGIFDYYFDSIIGDGEPYVTLTLRNTASNASVSYNFRVYPKLSISLDKGYITFS